MSQHRWKKRIKAAACAAGFEAVGFAAAADLGARAGIEDWLARAYHGTMGWMSRDPSRRRDPRHLLSAARTVVSLAVNYFHPAGHESQPGTGRISRYAWGGDYHREIGRQLHLLLMRLRAGDPDLGARAYVDTGPVLEKPWAHAAGIGWVGKNANLIIRGRGSWFFLSEVLLTRELEPDPPATDHCGTCRRCIDACPTAAIVAPAVVDSRRCISYLTIEHRGAIEPGLRAAIADWIFGCDVCQDVCPWNKFSRPSVNPTYAPRDGHRGPRLSALARLTREEFASRFRGSNLRRPGYAGFLRNVMVALGNAASEDAGPALRAGLAHSEPLVRAHAAWGLGRRGEPAGRTALARQARHEEDPAVRVEIAAALERGGTSACGSDSGTVGAQ